MGYDKELTKQMLGDVGALHKNPYVIKTCDRCGGINKVRYRGLKRQTEPYICRSCNGKPAINCCYDEELTKQMLGDIGPLRFNPWVIKVCKQCGKAEKRRYHGGGKPTNGYYCQFCIMNRPEVRHKLSEYAIKQWEDPEFRKLVVASSKAIWDDPELRERMSTLRSNPDSHYTTGWHESLKGGRAYYRSAYELLYFQHLDSNINVLKYKAEPLFDIQYEFDGIRAYRPDVLVTYVDHQELVEIKPIKRMSLPRNIAKMVAGQIYCNKHNLVFVVITEPELAKLTTFEARDTLRCRESLFNGGKTDV